MANKPRSGRVDDDATVVAGGTDAFSIALEGARTAPERESTWDTLEELVRETGRAEETGNVYREVIAGDLPAPLILKLAERAVRFHDEWLGDVEAVIGILARVLEVDPTAVWAFDRVSLHLTVLARWEALLALYDRAIAATTTPARKVALLEEAAHLAKDCAGQTDRALRYLEELFSLDPSDAHVASQLERLLKQQKRYPELIKFWTARLDVVQPADALAIREQIAICWLQDLNDPNGALASIESLLADPLSADSACTLLERILGSASSEVGVRRSALQLLRQYYDRTDRWMDIVRALRIALVFVDRNERVELHSEITRRLVEHEQDDEALEHLASLAVLDPTTWDDGMLDRVLTGKFKDKIAGCRPKLSREKGREVVHRAAALAAGDLQDSERAEHLYRRVLERSPDDVEALECLAGLYEKRSATQDLLELRRHELKLTEDPARRIELRLQLARLLGIADEQPERIASLRQNLLEQPDHEPSIQALVEVLEGLNRHSDLAQMLCEQAERVQEFGGMRLAADLWWRAARVLEDKLRDLQRSVLCLERVVSLSATPAALDALARIQGLLGDHAAAVRWLEQRLELSEKGKRTDTIVRLVRAQIGASRQEQALAKVQQGLLEDPTSLEMRKLEAELHRSAGRWEDLARVLQEGAQWADETTRLAFLREAAEVYKSRLRAPERAVPVLEQATKLAPSDRAIRAALADALRVAGRVAEARTMAEGLIEEFGKRRPPERAALHLLLAEVLHAAGDQQEAIRQLESAVSMDMSNTGVQHLLGDLYRKTGQLDRAERAYQALLLLLRRQRGQARAELTVGVAETLLNLHRVAAQLGAADRAAENLESAFEVASRDEAEARLFEKALREAGDSDLLLRALEIRLQATQDLRGRCEILVEMATAFIRLGKASEALEAWLRAINELPGSADLHESARSLALRSKLVRRYAEHLDQLAQTAASQGEAALAADLLLRLGNVQEQDLLELDKAAKSYLRAENTGEHLIDAWRALARVSAARGDQSTQLGALRRLAEAGTDALAPEERVEVLFTLADLELSSKAIPSGLATLSEAIEHAPQHERAAVSLRKALESEPDNDNVLALFERVARASGREDLLLDALSRISATPRATQELLQEAASLARRLHAAEQYLGLLNRSVQIADESGDSRPALWALRLLAEYCRQAGDSANAIAWMVRAAEAAEAAEARELRFRIAELAAGPAQDLELAASTYERLLETDVTDTSIWNPLLEVVRRLGDRDRLSRLLSDAADAVFDPRDRSALRLERARILLESGTDDAEAMAVLRKILEEEPDHVEAAQVLCDLLQKSGDREELAQILSRQLEAARERLDSDAGVSLALRLGSLLGPNQRLDAVEILRSVLDWVPDDLVLLRALLGLLRPEEDASDRADVLERLLRHEAGPEAIALALDLAKMRETLGDLSGLERAILHAYQVDPQNADVLRELGRFAERLEIRAAEDAQGGLSFLVKAASIYRDRLNNTAAAAAALTKAHALRPGDRPLLESLSTCLVDSGQPRSAVAAVTESIDTCAEGSAELVELLLLRARLWTSCEEHDAAVVDLERALALGGDSALTDLHQALLRARRTAAARKDQPAERKATMRLPEVLIRMGNPDQARTIMAEWVSRAPDDREALHALLAMDLSAERWDDVADAYAQLVDLEQGQAQVDAALHLADACEKAGRANDARDALEKVYQADSSNAAVRGRLRRLYEQIGAHREMANLMLIEAKHVDEAQRFDLLKEAGRIRLHELRQPTAAIGPLSEALELRATDHEATLLLADAYTVAGLVDEAAQMLDAAISRHGGKRSRELASLQHRMARVAALGDRENELSWLYAAFDSNPQSGDIAAELADLAMELGHYEVALKALRAITSMKNPSPMSRPMAYLKQAKIAYQQGDERKAVFFAKKAQAEDAEFLEAKEFLQVIGQGGG